jgi:hypothetical protein
MFEFEAIVGMKLVGKYKSFNKALIKFLEEISIVLKAGTSVQWLETANFLVSTGSSDPIGVMTFYEARDFAYDIGLMVDGEIQQGVAEPAAEVVSKAFKDCATQREIGEVEQFLSLVEEVLKLVE